MALKGSQSTNRISGTFGVHPTQINAWKKQAEESLEHAFADKRTKEGKTQEHLIKELYQLVGQRDHELAWLKQNLKFATGNQNKLKEAREILGFEIERLDIDIKEIQEIDVRKVIEHKAKTAFDCVGALVLVEDTSLEIEAFDGLPGALIKWFLKSVGNDGICKMLSVFVNKKARAVTCVAIYDGTNIIIGEGVASGTISEFPRGETNFGWDPIFIPDGYDKTFAEMTSEEKNKISMRRLAFENFKEKILKL